jgi:hypothetical protein
MQNAKRKMKFPYFAFLIFNFALLSACVPIPPEMMPQAPGAPTAQGAAYPDIDPGGTTQTTLHFTLKGYNDNDLRTIGGMAEDIFNKIGSDTGLYSYLAGQNYTLIVYKDQNEYTTKTKQPTWSHAIAAGSAIYMYNSPDSDPELAHQLMHLIFTAYMGSDKATSLRWLMEGLAMHEEILRMAQSDQTVYYTSQSNQLRQKRMPFAQMTFFVTTSEEHRRDDVWYQQVESVVSYLLKQGSNLAFGALMNSLHNGSDIDHALSDNYSGKYRGFADLETAWQLTI